VWRGGSRRGVRGGRGFERGARLVLLGALLAALGVPLGAGPAASAPTFTRPPLTIAMIGETTGLGAPLFQNSPEGFLARIDLQNARGGVDGHELVPLIINDQTNPTTDATAVQEAVSRGVIGIVADTPLFYAGYKYATAAGIPVTGGGFDGPEWGERPNTNMFASDVGSWDPRFPAYTSTGAFLRSLGGTVLGTYGIGISPSSTDGARGAALSFQRAGGKVGVVDTTVPFGTVDFTTEALLARQKGVNAVWAGMGNNQNFALATAFKQAGIRLKAVLFPTGYEEDIVHQPVWQDLLGDDFSSEFRPTAIPDAGTRQMVAALRKYQKRSPSNFPTYDVYESWLGADLLIKGLEHAGPTPTHARVITALRDITSYNGNGLLPVPIDYSTIFGHDLPKQCSWIMRATKKGWVAVSTRPYCGTIIPESSTTSGS